MINAAQLFYSGDLRETAGVSRTVSFYAKRMRQAAPTIQFITKGLDRDLDLAAQDSWRCVDIYPIKHLLQMTPLRWNLKKMFWLEGYLFDYAASLFVIGGGNVFAVQGQALQILKHAKKKHSKTHLIVHSLHVSLVRDIHARLSKELSGDFEWLGEDLYERCLEEYKRADAIIVQSRLSFDIFLEYGIPKEKLVLWPLEIDRDFFQRRREKCDEVFRVLYVGRLTPEKGIVDLIKVFQALALPKSELVLFGGFAVKSFQVFINKMLQGWPNIRIRCGDPRPAYEEASVLAHPSYQDAFAYTVAEALAYGLPVIVSQHTGAKDLIEEGRNGYVVPAGDRQALKEKISSCWHRCCKQA